jgi:hypothetical protein
MPFFPPICVRGPRPPRRPWVEREPRTPTDEEVAAELLLARHLEAFDAAPADVDYEVDGEDNAEDGRLDDGQEDVRREKEKQA